MENNDTIHLLKECNSGTKMAVVSIDEVLEKDCDPKLKKLLMDSKEHHEKLGNEIHELLLKLHKDDKEPNLMAKGMSWFKTNIKVGMEDNNHAIAELMTDGCDMGIKSLHKYLHQYTKADYTSKDICKRLISMEETLRRDLQAYL